MKTKYILKSTESFHSINHSPMNRSRSKQTYSFSKSSRFDLAKPECPKNTYNGSQILRKNSGAGIGYGRKSDFTKVLTSSPGSTKYQLKSSFEENKSKKKGYSLRPGRQTIVYDSYVSRESCRTPSSHHYHNEVNLKSKAPIFSMRKKTKELDKKMTINSQNDNPGPGAYKNPQIESSSSYASKFQKLSYGTSRSKRFLNSDNKVPGPANYNDVTSLSSVGKYIVSSHRGGTGGKFAKDHRVAEFERVAKINNEKPGPGRYRSPSEFGQYDGNDIYNTYNTISVTRMNRRR